jgi:precorrin-2 dehydrogenase/sirohydrochlorin ferrochelatase
MAGSGYPVALEVADRRCVVVGGGPVGARKAAALAECGAGVTVIAPEVSDSLRELAGHGTVTLLMTPFSPEHLDGAFLAIAATDDPAVNAAVLRAARERGVLVNAAADASDEMGHGDFTTMATLRRGDLLVGITTGGAGPAVAARLRRELEARFGPEWAPYITLLGEMRQEAKARIGDARRRAEALRRLAEADEIRARIAAGDADGAREEAQACLSR